MIDKILQPPVRREIRHRGGHDEGDPHQLRELLRQQYHNVADRRAEHLAHADLFGALLGGERRQPQQPQARDDHGKQRKIGDDRARAFFLQIHRVEPVVEERARDGVVGHDRSPGLIDVSQRGGQVGCRELDRQVVAPAPVDKIDQRLDLVVDRREVNVLRHADDREGDVAQKEALADSFLLRPPGLRCGRFIQDERAGAGRILLRRLADPVGAEVSRKRAPGHHLNAEGVEEFVIDGIDAVEERVVVLGLAGEAETRAGKEVVRRNQRRAGHLVDGRVLQELVAERLVRLVVHAIEA